MKKTVLFIIAAAIILVGGFYAFNSWIYKEKQGDGSEIQTYRGSLSGEYVCLVEEGARPSTAADCIHGLLTEVGEKYILNFDLSSQPVLTLGDKISAQGMITPIELLSTDHWQKYDIEGIFSVTDSVKVQ